MISSPGSAAKWKESFEAGIALLFPDSLSSLFLEPFQTFCAENLELGERLCVAITGFFCNRFTEKIVTYHAVSLFTVCSLVGLGYSQPSPQSILDNFLDLRKKSIPSVLTLHSILTSFTP